MNNYVVLKNPHRCDECGWIRLKPKMAREQALIASALNRKQAPQHGWMAKKVRV